VGVLPGGPGSVGQTRLWRCPAGRQLPGCRRGISLVPAERCQSGVGPRQSVETNRVGSPQASRTELRGAFSPAKTRLLRLCASAYDPTQLHAFFGYPNAASKRQNRLKLPIILIQINQLAWSDPFEHTNWLGPTPSNIHFDCSFDCCSFRLEPFDWISKLVELDADPQAARTRYRASWSHSAVCSDVLRVRARGPEGGRQRGRLSGPGRDCSRGNPAMSAATIVVRRRSIRGRPPCAEC
jgi:hypothetical protein